MLSKGQLIGWGHADVKNLITNANRAHKEKFKEKEYVNILEMECILALEWLETFLEKGATKEVLRQLNGIIGHVRYHHVLTYSNTGLPFWRRIANADEMDRPEIAVAYAAAQLLASGAFEKLKRCKMRSCARFFIGRPDAKWCSDSCGSSHRVIQKRKRDRSR